MKRERALMIKTPSGEKIAGKLLVINGEWCFYREVAKARHAFKTFDAWSIQASLLPVLEQDGVKWIYQYDRQAGQMYRISLGDFKAKSRAEGLRRGAAILRKHKVF